MNPGEGNIDFASLLGRLESSGYRRHYAMAFGAADDEIVARERLAVEGCVVPWARREGADDAV